jgi:D-alanyl-D-alanine carboxypeptidase
LPSLDRSPARDARIARLMRPFYPVRQCCWLTVSALVFAGCAVSPHHDFSTPATVRSASSASEVGRTEVLRDGGDGPQNLAVLLESVRARRDLPALAAVVVRGDEIIAWGAAGVRRRGADAVATVDDAYEIASCAKSMHAHVIAQLVENHILEWDRPVAAYFPNIQAHPDWSRITLRHLLSHTAGVRDPTLSFLRSTYFDRRSLPERRAGIAQRLLRRSASPVPGYAVAYSNADYIIAAAAAEAMTRQSWEQLVHTHLFERLGMQRAGFGPPGEPGKTTAPWGHGKWRLLQLDLVGNFAFDPGSREADYNAMASPAGFVHLSLHDWASFASLHLRADTRNPHRNVKVLSSESFATLHQALPGVDYAGGWFIGTRPWAKGGRADDLGRVLYHLGQNGRWSSAAWLAPEIDLAILVVANQGGSHAAVDDVAGKLVKAYAGRMIAHGVTSQLPTSGP